MSPFWPMGVITVIEGRLVKNGVVSLCPRFVQTASGHSGRPIGWVKGRKLARIELGRLRWASGANVGCPFHGFGGGSSGWLKGSKRHWNHVRLKKRARVKPEPKPAKKATKKPVAKKPEPKEKAVKAREQKPEPKLSSEPKPEATPNAESVVG